MPVEGKPDRHPGGQPDGARSTGAALEAHYRFVLWLVPAVERFPRSQKFLLGDRIQGAALDSSSASSKPPTRSSGTGT